MESSEIDGRGDLRSLIASVQDNSFDLVWACESGEHMPDKKRYVEVSASPGTGCSTRSSTISWVLMHVVCWVVQEMVRVLKPGGTLVIACWCQVSPSCLSLLSLL